MLQCFPLSWSWNGQYLYLNQGVAEKLQWVLSTSYSSYLFAQRWPNYLRVTWIVLYSTHFTMTRIYEQHRIFPLLNQRPEMPRRVNTGITKRGGGICLEYILIPSLSPLPQLQVHCRSAKALLHRWTMLLFPAPDVNSVHQNTHEGVIKLST